MYDDRIKFKCPECGRFVSWPKPMRNGMGDIIRLESTCEVHGKQDVRNTADWCYEDFFPEGG